MANRTIHLDEICEGIRLKMRERDPFFSFSLWIRSKMLEEYNKGQTNLAVFERLVPPDFICTNCGMRGSHWSPECPHIIVGEEE